MSNTESLKENIARMEQELAEMKRKLEEQNSSYKMVKGDFCLLSDGTCFTVRDEAMSDKCFKQGNVFANTKHVNTLRNMREKWGLFTSAAIEIADGWEPDWKDSLQRKYYVFIDHISGKFTRSCWVSTENPMTVYLPTKEAAQRLADWANENLRFD